MADRFNRITQNSQGDIKGGARAVDTFLNTGDVLVHKIYVKRAASPAREDLIGVLESDAMPAPDRRKRWYWFARTWLEQIIKS